MVDPMAQESYRPAHRGTGTTQKLTMSCVGNSVLMHGCRRVLPTRPRNTGTTQKLTMSCVGNSVLMHGRRRVLPTRPAIPVPVLRVPKNLIA